MSGLPAGLQILIIVLSVLLAAVIFLSVWALTEPHILKVTRIKMFPAGKSSGFKKQSPAGTSSAAPGLRLFFFSDLHADICLIKPERLISALQEAHPSYVLAVGLTSQVPLQRSTATCLVFSTAAIPSMSAICFITALPPTEQ